MRLRGRVWLLLLLLLARLRLYVPFRRLLIAARIDAELLVECGDHSSRMAFRDLPWTNTHGKPVRPGTLDD